MWPIIIASSIAIILISCTLYVFIRDLQKENFEEEAKINEIIWEKQLKNLELDLREADSKGAFEYYT